MAKSAIWARIAFGLVPRAFAARSARPSIATATSAARRFAVFVSVWHFEMLLLLAEMAAVSAPSASEYSTAEATRRPDISLRYRDWPSEAGPLR